ncbi:hypothetical protein ACFVXR_20855 [Bacillus thuringiensis]|nr:hypothetical protein [Bacillus thuringiensis]
MSDKEVVLFVAMIIHMEVENVHGAAMLNLLVNLKMLYKQVKDPS